MDALNGKINILDINNELINLIKMNSVRSHCYHADSVIMSNRIQQCAVPNLILSAATNTRDTNL